MCRAFASCLKLFFLLQKNIIPTADVMTLHCHIVLVLLAPIISQCGAIEYYVKPTDFINSTCPGQPCLTLNEYTNSSTYYIKSNTVFMFMPGNHIAVRPILIRDVENISLTGFSNKSDTKILTHYICKHVMNSDCYHGLKISVEDYYSNAALEVCCSVIGLINVSHASIKGISIETTRSGIVGVAIQKSHNVFIQIDIFSTEKCINDCSFGLFGFKSSLLVVDVMQGNRRQRGLLFLKTSNTIIQNSVFLSSVGNYANDCGVYLQTTDTVRLLNTTISNFFNGIIVNGARNTTMEKVTITDNFQYALKLFKCINTVITDMYADSRDDGYVFLYSSNDTLINTLFTKKTRIICTECTDTAVMNVFASYIRRAISIDNSKHVHLQNITLNVISNFGGVGIAIHESINTTIRNCFSQSVYDQIPIRVWSSTDTNILHSSVTSRSHAIHILECMNTIMVNTSITNLQKEGKPKVCIVIQSSTTVTIINVTVPLFKRTGLDFHKCNNVSLHHSRFLHHTGTKEYFLLSAVLTLIDTNLMMGNCVFMKNTITSILAVNSNITLQESNVFTNNRALSGAVFTLATSSVLIISQSCAASFQNNTAFDYGGVFYIFTKELINQSMALFDIQTKAKIGSEVTSITNCFIHVEGERSRARLNFSANTAGRGGDILFGGQVASGWDGNVNCLESFKNMSDLSGQSGESVISSAPSRICLCHNSQHDCLIVADPTTHTIYPGETLMISAVVVGQDFGSVTGSIIAQLMVPSGLSPSILSLKEGQNSVQFNKGLCKDLYYTFYTNCVDCEAVLVLKADNAEVLDIMTTEDNHKLNYTWNFVKLSSEISNWEYLYNHSDLLSSLSPHTIKTTSDGKIVFPKEIYHYPLYINVSFRSCPSGFTLTALPPFQCECINFLKRMSGVQCTIQDQLISRVGSVWVGKYGNKSVAASEYCPYNYCTTKEINITLSSNPNATHHDRVGIDMQCNYNRSGALCGGCHPGLSLALGSDRCLECSSYFVFLLLLYAVAGIILVLFISVLNLTVSEGTLNGLIFYANVIKANQHLYYSQTSINPLTLFTAWLNLDLGIETCFVNGLTAYGRTWLQFVFPLYIWTIASLFIVLAKKSHRMAKVMGTNCVQVLATTFLLSYTKLFNIILTALSYTTLYTTEGQKLVWSADGNIAYLGREHAPLFTVALVTLFFLWFPYTFLILVGHTLHRFNFRIIPRSVLKLKPFLDAHYAAFKPRHQYWFGLLLIVRAAVLLMSAVIPSENVRIVVLLIAMCSIVLNYWGEHVYCNSVVSNFSTAFFMNLALLNLTKLFVDDTHSELSFNIITGISLLQFIGLVVYKLVSLAKHNRRVMTFFISKRERAYQDDVELFEMASAEREIESESDEEESLEDDDMNNPTY